MRERGDGERAREAKREGEIDRRTEIKGREREKDDQQRKMPEKKHRLKEKRKRKRKEGGAFASQASGHPSGKSPDAIDALLPSRRCAELQSPAGFMHSVRKGSMQVIADDNIN